MKNSRRNFIKKATTTGAAFLLLLHYLDFNHSFKAAESSNTTTPFKLKYAPGFGMFREHAGQDPIDNIKFCHDQGFRAIFDNGLMRRTFEDQEKIANEINSLVWSLDHLFSVRIPEYLFCPE